MTSMIYTITITPAAMTHLKNKVQQQKGKGFRLSMKKYGCNGYTHTIDIIDDISDDLFYCLDPAYAPHLHGTVIDYVAKNLGQYQLVFNNPNVQSVCGCGESVYLNNADHAENV